MKTPQFMSIGPCGGTGSFRIDKGNLQLGGACEKSAEQRLLFPVGIHLQIDLVVMLQKLKFLPAFIDKLFQFCNCFLAYCLITINSNKSKKGISRCNRKFFPSCCLKFQCKSGINRAEIQFIVIIPDLFRPFSNQALQSGKASLLCKPYVVYFGKLVKIHKLIINLIFLFFCFRRKDTGNNTRNRNSVIVLQNTDPFISFLHIKFIHVFIGLDRVTNPFVYMTCSKNCPLIGKFCIFTQNGHKIPCKGIASGFCFCSHNLLHGNLNQSQRNF